MSAYNVAPFIRVAIESIISQTYRDFEFVIVDDHSRDGTWDIIREYALKDSRIITIRNERNLGISASCNTGVGYARGEYIVRMDADDWSYPTRLEKQIEHMDRYPEVVVSGGTMEVCDKNLNVLNKRTYRLTDEEIRKNIFYFNPFCHPATIYRTDALRKTKGYSKLRTALDYELYFQLGLVGNFSNLPDTLIKYRVNKGSISISRAREQEFTSLYIRLKAVFEYGYEMDWKGKLYFIGQFLSMYIFPTRAKLALFNLVRGI
jgi:glycosyltransferase involved in cell wall biosynthesis